MVPIEHASTAVLSQPTMTLKSCASSGVDGSRRYNDSCASGTPASPTRKKAALSGALSLVGVFAGDIQTSPGASPPQTSRS